jgi:6-phosphogluconate dehydrogenase
MQLGVLGLGRMGGNIARRLIARFRSREDHALADRLLSAMRKEFGGHIEAKGP